jgi:Ca2+-binding EF-hand superfamily protein
MRINGADRTTEAESIAPREMFRRADQVGDGKITEAELAKSLPERAQGPNGLKVDDLFKQIDANQDGGIDEAEHNEFLSTMRSRHGQGPNTAEFAQKLFEKADADGDGKLTQAEMMSALPKELSSAFEALFKETDEDGDGVISQAELKESLDKRMAASSGTYTRSGETTDTRRPRFLQVG